MYLVSVVGKIQGLLGSNRSHTRSPASVTPRVVCSPHPACSEGVKDNAGRCGWPTLCLRTQFRSAGPARRSWPRVVITATNRLLSTALLCCRLTCWREAAAHLVTTVYCCPSSRPRFIPGLQGCVTVTTARSHHRHNTDLGGVTLHCVGWGRSGTTNLCALWANTGQTRIRSFSAGPLVNSLVIDFSNTDRLVLCTAHFSFDPVRSITRVMISVLRS